MLALESGLGRQHKGMFSFVVSEHKTCVSWHVFLYVIAEGGI